MEEIGKLDARDVIDDWFHGDKAGWAGASPPIRLIVPLSLRITA
jgi:hypothetical protein